MNRLFLSILPGFTLTQISCCIFPVAVFLLLGISVTLLPDFIPRYDFLLIGCILVQYLMWKFQLESGDELKVILLFHVLGLALELFKVHNGSWSYPETAYSKFYGVPLYSGFMYASVASYICQAWKKFELTINNYPATNATIVYATLIYLNFFAHHYFIDCRWVLLSVLPLLFRRTTVQFTFPIVVPHPISQLSSNYFSSVQMPFATSGRKCLTMPLNLSFLLIGFFIWIAENIATGMGAWMYPNQKNGWHMVHLSKISSWWLLVIISIVIVAVLKKIKYGSLSAGKTP